MLYHENMFVRLRTSHQTFRFLRIKGIPTFLQGRKAATFKHCAMSIDQDRSDIAVRSDSHKKKSCCVIALDDVRPLCEIFLTQYIKIHDIPAHWTFKVTILRSFESTSIDDAAPNLPQRRLLEPFTVLYDTPDFEIVGSVSSAYCTSIAAQVSRMSPTMKTCFNEILQMGHQGCKKASRNDRRGAIQLHKMAFAQLYYFFSPRMFKLRDRGVLHPQGEYFAQAARLKIRANLAIFHYRLKEFEDASFWACYHAPHETYHLRTLYWMRIHAQMTYIAAISNVLLDNRKEAVEMIYWGLTSMPQDVYQYEEIANLRIRAWSLMRGAGEAQDLSLLRVLGVSGCVDHWKQLARVSTNP